MDFGDVDFGDVDFGDVDFDEVVPLSIIILQWCIDACAAWLGEPRSPAGRCPPRRSCRPDGTRVDCDSLGLRARQGCFVAVLGEVTADAALTFRLTGVDGFFRRVVVAFPWQDRVCALVLGARVVLQHAGDRLPSGGEVDGACFTGGALVPQLREPTADVPVLFQDRFVDLGFAAVVVVSHTEQYAGCRVIVLAKRRAFAGPTSWRAHGR